MKDTEDRWDHNRSKTKEQARFPWQELWGNFTGPLVRISTAGTSPEGPFTGTLTKSLLRG